MTVAPFVVAALLLGAAPAKTPVAARDAGAADAGVFAVPQATLTQKWTDATLHGPVLAITFSNDGSRIAVGSGDKHARVYDAANGKVLGEFSGAKTSVSAVAFSPDGQLLAIGESALAVRLYRVDTGKIERQFPHPDSVSGITFSPDGRLLAVSGHSSTGVVYSAADAKRLWEYQGRNTAFASDSKRMVSAVAAGALREWNVATGKSTGEVKTAPHQPWLSASSDLSVIVSWNPSDKEVHLWSATSNAPLGTFKGHEKGVFSAAVSADGKHAVSASEDHTVRLWDVASKQLVGHMPIDQFGFVALSPDGQTLAVAVGNRVTVSQVAW